MAPLLLLHGTGGNEHDLVPLARQMAPQRVIISPRGQVLENGVARRFFRRHAEGVLDLEDLTARTIELTAWLRQVRAQHELETLRFVALGYSNGANMATSLLWHAPDLFRGAVLWRPMLPYTPDPLPSLKTKELLILSGQGDPMGPADQVAELVRIYEEAGASVTHQAMPGGHGLSERDLHETKEWLAGQP